jgi:hypothetical protein
VVVSLGVIGRHRGKQLEMSLRPSPRSTLLVAAIAFGPAMFVLCAFLAPITLFGLADSRSPSGFSSDVPDLVALFLLALLPLIAAIVFSLLAASSARFVRRALAIYLGLSVFSLSIAFILSASLAGASMAVAEGATSGWTLKAQELQFAVWLLLPMQLLIVPWTAISSLISIRLSAVAPGSPAPASPA